MNKRIHKFIMRIIKRFKNKFVAMKGIGRYNGPWALSRTFSCPWTVRP